LPQRLEQIARAGYHYVELASEYLKWSQSEYRDFNHNCESLRLSVDIISGSISEPVSAVNPPDRAEFLASIQPAIEAAGKLNCPHVIVFSGRVAKGVTRETQRQSIVDRLKSAADLAGKHGSSCCSRTSTCAPATTFRVMARFRNNRSPLHASSPFHTQNFNGSLEALSPMIDQEI